MISVCSDSPRSWFSDSPLINHSILPKLFLWISYFTFLVDFVATKSRMAKRSFKCFVEQELGKFPLFVIYAVLEWLLIIMLFVDGFLAFAANEFAKFFEMRVPCLLCTRIDHVLVRRSPDFYYNDSVCEAHKKEVSSLAYCHVHKKLSDIRKMCEGCLLSFATEKESDCDTYKSLVGILHKDLECFVQDDSGVHLALPSGKKDERVEVKKSGNQRCTCCGEPLKTKPSSHSKNGPKSRRSTSPISQAPAPSPRGPFVTLRNEDAPNLMLPHIRYTELKFNPDAGSDVPGHDASLNALLPDNQGNVCACENHPSSFNDLFEGLQNCCL